MSARKSTTRTTAPSITITQEALQALLVEAAKAAVAAYAATAVPASPSKKGKTSKFDALVPGETRTHKGHKVTFEAVTEPWIEKFTGLVKKPYVVALDGVAIKDRHGDGRVLPDGTQINAILPCSFGACKNSRDEHSQYCPDCKRIQREAYGRFKASGYTPEQWVANGYALATETQKPLPKLPAKSAKKATK